MIRTLIELAEREQDRLVEALRGFQQEQQVISQERLYWRSAMRQVPLEGLAYGDDVARWLCFGTRADKELQALAEKDFVVEGRIHECRTALASISRRIQTLETVVKRREEGQQKVLQRREARELSQRGVQRRAKEEAEGEPWD